MTDSSIKHKHQLGFTLEFACCWKVQLWNAVWILGQKLHFRGIWQCYKCIEVNHFNYVYNFKGTQRGFNIKSKDVKFRQKRGHGTSHGNEEPAAKKHCKAAKNHTLFTKKVHIVQRMLKLNLNVKSDSQFIINLRFSIITTCNHPGKIQNCSVIEPDSNICKREREVSIMLQI